MYVVRGTGLFWYLDSRHHAPASAHRNQNGTRNRTTPRGPRPHRTHSHTRPDGTRLAKPSSPRHLMLIRDDGDPVPRILDPASESVIPSDWMVLCAADTNCTSGRQTAHWRCPVTIRGSASVRCGALRALRRAVPPGAGPQPRPRPRPRASAGGGGADGGRDPAAPDGRPRRDRPSDQHHRRAEFLLAILYAVTRRSRTDRER
jgi:hypothetical protein